ncbi:polyadenylate-binding protein RBP45-like [Phalaenopsis equestris]|uniref:polyadenylate-binding protein RBP45-like n=1 Tax=Phalaenopsis equestris TaxID=78828 RepID=UPI0009E3BE80|nr:polyadenylate-binding protein RBP45-like [Phalaenopsis equestris]
MQGGGMVPQSVALHHMEPQHQMAQPSQYQMLPQQAPPLWGMVPPPAPQQQYPPSQQLPMWNQQLSQIPPPQSMQQPQQQQQHFQNQYGAPMAMPSSFPSHPDSSDEVRTLWIGDLQYWMEETYIHGCFAQSGEVMSVKLIRNRQTGQLEGYGFIEFATRAAADRVLQTYNGTLMPNSEQVFRLNWASAGGKRADDGNDYTIFVGDLSADVTDSMLQETFGSHYPSVKGAKIVTDRITGRSKGYGFVRFGDVNEQTRAMTEMNGVYCSSRPMRIGPAASKKASDGQQQDVSKASFQNVQASESDPNNTTIFVGGLDPNVSEDMLRQVFSPYGELDHVKIPIGKRCGFVQFISRACAEEALLMLQGTQLGGLKIRLSWGRNAANKQSQQQDGNQWNGGYYGFGQGYEAYGYGQAPQDPNMYAYGAYPGYGNFQQQQ